jgi:hypothetical protein
MRMIGQARECFTSKEIAERLNAEGGRAAEPYTEAEIEGWAKNMSALKRSGTKYCLKPEDANQAAARIVRESTRNE